MFTTNFEAKQLDFINITIPLKSKTLAKQEDTEQHVPLSWNKELELSISLVGSHSHSNHSSKTYMYFTVLDGKICQKLVQNAQNSHSQNESSHCCYAMQKPTRCTT